MLGHGLGFYFKKTKMFQGIKLPWHVQIMYLHPRGANTILWINNNPFKTIKERKNERR